MEMKLRGVVMYPQVSIRTPSRFLRLPKGLFVTILARML